VSVTEVEARIAAIRARFGAVSVHTAAPAGRSFASYLSAARPAGEAPALARGGAPTGEAIVATARRYLGVPYVWGGEDANGFDCSGLVQRVFAENGINLPRVSRDQARAGVPVGLDDLQPGDLVFFGDPVDHVGIYAGDGKMIAAPHRGDVVRVQDVDFGAVTAARRVIPAPSAGWAAQLPPAGRRWADAIERAASAASLDPRLVAAVAWAESGFDPGAVSPAGALGLMQLMPATARGLGVDPLDPAQNLAGGARYLAAQLDRFGGRLELALAAYNAGPAAVAKAGGIPQNGETPRFVARVLALLSQLRGGR
jgi:cell wall-associated NlpC family hydrolase